MNRGTLLLAACLMAAVPGAQAASPVVPHIYRSGVNLGPYGGTVSRAVTYYRDTVYVSVDAEDCHIGTQYSPYVIYALDVSDPDNVRYLARGGLGGCKANGLTAREDLLYVAGWDQPLRIFDISTRWNLNEIATFDPPTRYGWDVSVSGNRAYIAEARELESSFYIMDISNPTQPTPLCNPIDTGGPAVHGSYSYSTERGGTRFRVLNISDESNPSELAAVDAGVYLGEVALRYPLAFVKFGRLGDPAGGMVVYQVSNPLQPVEVGRWVLPDAAPMRGVTLLGDLAFLPTSGNGFYTVDISDPASPRLLAQSEVPYYSLELAICGNGRFIYVGTAENGGGLHAFEVLDQDPDDAGPSEWSNCSLGEAAWDLQFEGDRLPSASGWTLVEGQESCATAESGVLRINDDSSQSGAKVKWSHEWAATSSRGTTTLVRARCRAYSAGGSPLSYLGNIFVRDGTGSEEFLILADRFRAANGGAGVPLGGTQWHTYRITTQGQQYQVYIDEASAPALTGPLFPTTEARVAEVWIGSGSSAGTQDIDFDFVHCFSGGAVAPPAPLSTSKPNVTIKVNETAGQGSTSGLAPDTARIHWSNDGGDTWSSSGGALWQHRYEGDVLPSDVGQNWLLAEGTSSIASISQGALRINDASTNSGSKLKYARSWNASPAVGLTVLARMRCPSAGGDLALAGNIYVEDGAHLERFAVRPDRLVAGESGRSVALTGAQWHLYRITARDGQFAVYVDEAPSPALSGPLTTSTQQRRIMIGSGASAATQDISFDSVYYTTLGALPPGEGGAGGPVSVLCSPVNNPGPPDRGWISASGIPFDQNSAHLNRLRFSIQDMAGNVGWSPIFTVPIAGAAPGPATKLTTRSGDGRVRLIWQNPTSLDLESVVVRADTAGYPAGPAEGTLMTESPATPGTVQEAIHTNLDRGAVWYYAVWARNHEGIYSTAARVMARAALPPDQDQDGDVDQSDFGLFQACMSGPDTSIPAGCTAADLDGDHDVDQDDFAAFPACMAGNGVPPPCEEWP